MKIVIIGGGIAGIAFGILMKKKGHHIVINERHNEIPAGGNAFLMHEDGLNILKKIFGEQANLPGSCIDTFILKKPDDTEVKNSKLENWQCIKRKDLINQLVEHVGNQSIRYKRSFSHFIYKNDLAIASVFENGEIEYGDIFVGADGCHSEVRKQLFGETVFTKMEVQEILGIVHNPTLAKALKGVFTKYQHPKKGISFGCIPLSDSELIWFNQFDVKLSNYKLDTKKGLQSFSKEILAEFPPMVHDIIDATDFSGSFLWNTKDFDTLNSFHKNNIVIIGDAAHVALPFTSAGTTNALQDAERLATIMETDKNVQSAFSEFYTKRIKAIKEHLTLGRNLKNNFLQPNDFKNEIEIPLIKKSATLANHVPTKSTIEINYFTDPICSTCWAIQPQLKKIKSEYKNVKVNYIMGGLLPSWDNFNRGGIREPKDVIQHWAEVSIASQMPINNQVWLNDPIASSYPASIAFKAAQMQDTEKAMLFLRKLNERVFLHGINISYVEIFKLVAHESGLDAALLMEDYHHSANILFEKDIAYSKKLKISILPTFIFKLEGKTKHRLVGYQHYNDFEKVIKQLDPSSEKIELHYSDEQLFSLHPLMTKKEIMFIKNIDEETSTKYIDNLLNIGLIKENNLEKDVTFYSIAI